MTLDTENYSWVCGEGKTCFLRQPPVWPQCSGPRGTCLCPRISFHSQNQKKRTLNIFLHHRKHLNALYYEEYSLKTVIFLGRQWFLQFTFFRSVLILFWSGALPYPGGDVGLLRGAWRPNTASCSVIPCSDGFVSLDYCLMWVLVVCALFIRNWI